MKLTNHRQRVLKVISSSRTPLSPDTIAERACVSVKSIGKMLKYLHSFHVLRIAKWERSKRAPIPYYTTANGKPDAPKPEPLPNAEKCRLWKEKTNYAQRRYIKQGIPALNRSRPKNGLKVVDPLMAALTGALR